MPQDAPKATAAMSMGARARVGASLTPDAEAPKAPNAGAQPKPDDAEVMRLRGGDGHRTPVAAVLRPDASRPDRLVHLLPVHLLCAHAAAHVD